MKLTPFRMEEQQKKKAARRAKSLSRSFSGYVRWLIQTDLENAALEKTESQPAGASK